MTDTENLSPPLNRTGQPCSDLRSLMPYQHLSHRPALTDDLMVFLIGAHRVIPRRLHATQSPRGCLGSQRQRRQGNVPHLIEHGRRSHESRDVADRGRVLQLNNQLVGGERRGDPDRIEAHDPHREVFTGGSMSNRR